MIGDHASVEEIREEILRLRVMGRGKEIWVVVVALEVPAVSVISCAPVAGAGKVAVVVDLVRIVLPGCQVLDMASLSLKGGFAVAA